MRSWVVPTWSDWTGGCSEPPWPLRPMRLRPAADLPRPTGAGCLNHHRNREAPRCDARTLRRGRQDRQNEQALLPGVADAVGDPLGRDEHHPRLHGLLAVLEEECAAPGEHVVDLVHAGVGM